MNMKRVGTSLALALLFGTLSAVADPPQTRIVCKSGCTYSEVADAVDSITDSATDKRYTVVVYPGTYTKSITMKSYVGIVGFDSASTIILGTDGTCLGGTNPGSPCTQDSDCISPPSASCQLSATAIFIGTGVTETSFTGVTIGNRYPFFWSAGGSSSTTMTVNNCTVGALDYSTDCWYDTGTSAGHYIYATNVTLNVNADCIMPTPGSRFIGRNLTVISRAAGTTGFIRPGQSKGGWYVDIDGISHVSTLTSGTDRLFYWPAAIFGTTTGPILKIRNAVWSVTTTGTTAATQSCVNVGGVNGVSTTGDFEFTNLDCSLTATDASQTLYGYNIGSDADLANFRMHVQGGSTLTSGPGTRADVLQNGTASGFVFEMGSNRNSGTFSGGGTVSTISYHP